MTTPKTVSPAQLQQSQLTEDSLLILDVLPEEAYLERRLPGAAHACVYEVVFLDKVRSLTGSNVACPIVVYGESDDYCSAEEAAQRLAQAGYTHVSVLQGGVRAWQSAGLPLQGTGPRPPQLMADGNYPLDPRRSQVDWVGRNIANKHWGTLQLKSGDVEFSQGRLSGGTAILNMNAITCADIADPKLNQLLIGHLKSADFFDTSVHPEAILKIQSVQSIPHARDGVPNLHVAAALTLRGTRQPIEFDCLGAVAGDGDWVAQGSLELDRTRWNIRYGSGRFFERLGKHLVNDLIGIQLKVVVPKEMLRLG